MKYNNNKHKCNNMNKLIKMLNRMNNKILKRQVVKKQLMKINLKNKMKLVKKMMNNL